MLRLEKAVSFAVVAMATGLLVTTSLGATEVSNEEFIGTPTVQNKGVVLAELPEEQRVATSKIPPPGSKQSINHKPGETFKDCDNCPEMVVIPAGKFTMGSPESEEGRYGDESPQHQVSIRAPLAIGKYEVTFDEWDACVADGGCNNYSPDDRDWGRGRRPVIDISWTDANSYVEWLSKKTGKTYRLLTEAEWEYAARVGSDTPFYTGQTITTQQANFNGDLTYDGIGKSGNYRQETVPVGSFPANAFGLYDMHGNVWEWVQDCWNDSYHNAPTDGSAWTRGVCSLRVFRGGSWKENPKDLRSAVRGGDFALYSDFSFGLRVARNLD